MTTPRSLRKNIKLKEWDIMGKEANFLTLDLSGQHLSELPDEFSELNELEALGLNANKDIRLSEKFIKLTNLKVLSLAESNLDTVPAVVMKLQQLETLILSNNRNITLPDEMSSLVNLTYLNLDNCGLGTLPPVVLKLLNLHTLDLSDNKQISLPEEFDRLENIKVLALRDCHLDTVPPAVLKLSQLEELDLSGNRRIHLPDELAGLTNIRVLKLCRTGLDTVPPVVGRLTQLERLDLRCIPLRTFPMGIGQFTNVKHLDLSQCGLLTHPPEVWRLTQLEWLDLSYNLLQTLPAEVGQLTNVKHLDLSYYRLYTLPPEVGRLTQLEWLNLSGNPLQTLPAEVGQLTNVTHLDLSFCQLHTLPPEVRRLAQLEWLYLSYNLLQTLPAEIGQLTNVKHLDLSHCRLHTLPPEVGRLTELEWLNLSWNRLQALPSEVGQLTNLSHVDVRGNLLIKPPAEVSNKGIDAIRQYFEELKRSEEDVSGHLKVVVLGERKAGKTSLVRTLRCMKSTLTEEEDRTHCVEITQWTPDDNITFEVYDFGGHDVYHLTHQLFLTPEALYLLLVNLETYSCNEQSYEKAVGFWLDTLNARVPGAVVSLVGSKKDRCQPDNLIRKTNDIQRRTKLHVEMWESQLRQHIARLTSTSIQATHEKSHSKSMEGIAQRLANANRLLRQGLHICDVICVSVKPKSRIHRFVSSKAPSWVNLKNLLLETVSNKDSDLFKKLRRVLPTTWVLFEQLLQPGENNSFEETGSIKERYWLTSAEYEGIGRLVELSPERLEPVLSYLQQVGTILRYTDIPELKDYVFHNPPALVELLKGMFHHDTKALFSSPGLQKADYTGQQLHDFEQDLRECGLIRKDVMACLLPPNINPDIVTALMQHFGLCFQIQVKGQTDPTDQICWYRIPWYLREQMPQTLKRAWPEEVPVEQEQLQLMCDIRGFCPRGLFQRFSVGIHPLVKDRVDWKDGVMAYRHDYPVLVCSKAATDDTYITMATRGRLAQADEMWGVVHPLLEVLVQLLQEWPGVLYSLHVTCAHCIKAGLDNPHQYDLRDRTADDGRDVRCPRVMHTASTSADLVYRPGRFPGSNQRSRQLQGSFTLRAEVSGPPRDEFDTLKWLLTEVKVKDGAYEDNYSRLASHVSELGLTFRAEVPGDGNCMFHAVSDQVLRTEGRHITHLQLREQAVDHLRTKPHNARGDHLSDFILNQSWEEYLDTMSRDGTWGDHVVLQAMADMLARDVTVVSSLEADNYVTTLHPQPHAPPGAARPLLLGHYAENHYKSLDVDLLQGKPVVLLVNDEFGTSKGGISTINGQLMALLTEEANVLCTVINSSEEEKREAQRNGIRLLEPKTSGCEESSPKLDWLTNDHKSRYPHLPLNIGVIVGHADVTSMAARNIKNDRLPSAKFILYNHVMPEDTEHHKSDDKVMSIGDKMEAIREDTEEADVVFSVGPTMHDYYKNQIRGSKHHHLFLPKPSDIFSKMEVTYEETDIKVVYSVGRVTGVEKLKGHDLVAKAMGKVLDRFPKARLRIRGVSAEDFPESKEIIQANIAKGTFHFTPLKYGTQYQLSRDFQEAHLVLMPSRAEPFGLVGLEAIAAGVPVLVSSNSGLAEFLRSRGPEFERLVVEIEGTDDVVAEKLAQGIIEVLEAGREAFKAAKRLKDKLLASKYWEESHRKFLEECGIPQ